MTPATQAEDLKRIARMTAEELTGWEYGIQVSGRAYFEGEHNAIIRRWRELGGRK